MSPKTPRSLRKKTREKGYLFILGYEIPHTHFTHSIHATEHLTPVPLGGIIQGFLLHKQTVFLPADPSSQDGRPSMGKPEIKKKSKTPPQDFPKLTYFHHTGQALSRSLLSD